MKELENLLDFYDKRKDIIKSFVSSCNIGNDECLFGELCFCILTPQSRAKYCRQAINNMKKDDKLFTAGPDDLLSYLKGVRFPETKAQRIIEAREKLPELKKMLDSDPKELREWLVENVKGLGMKESAHFMRNIGFKGMAIIDVHIQNFLRKIGEIEVNKSMTKKRYTELEKKFLALAERIDVPPEELDIAIWMYQSGEKEFYG
jgi:N-glycosylase/DNA lyase